MQYWYNVITGEVETDENRSAASDVLGPYDSADEAAQAIASARARTEAEDAADRAWDDPDA